MNIKKHIGIDTSQPSTWRGIVMLIASAGITALPQQHMVWFLPLCLAIVGLLGFITRDQPEEKSYQLPPSAPTRNVEDVNDKPSLDELVRRHQE